MDSPRIVKGKSRIIVVDKGDNVSKCTVPGEPITDEPRPREGRVDNGLVEPSRDGTASANQVPGGGPGTCSSNGAQEGVKECPADEAMVDDDGERKDDKLLADEPLGSEALWDEALGDESVADEALDYDTVEGTVQSLKSELGSLRRAVERMRRDLLCSSYQKPFLPGESALNVEGSAGGVCRKCLSRCAEGGIYLVVSAEDVDCFLSEDAARTQPVRRRDWLELLGLGDVEVDCRRAGDGRRQLKVPNGGKSYHIGALGPHGFALGRAGLTTSGLMADWLPSLLEYRSFDRTRGSNWVFEFPAGESLSLVAVGSGFVVCVSDAPHHTLRVFAEAGVLLSQWQCPNAVSLVAKDLVFTVLLQTKSSELHVEATLLDWDQRGGRRGAKNYLDVDLHTSTAPLENGFKTISYSCDLEVLPSVSLLQTSATLHTRGHVHWLGLGDNIPMILPTVLTTTNEVFVLGSCLGKGGRIPKEFAHTCAMRSQTRTEPGEPAGSEAASGTHQWLCVCSDLQLLWQDEQVPGAPSVPRRSITVVESNDEWIKFAPQCGSRGFSYSDFTKVPFRLPLCLPPPIMSQKARYPVGVRKAVEFERSIDKTNFNPLCQPFLEEERFRRLSFTILPVLRLANTGCCNNSDLNQQYLQARTKLEVSLTRSALFGIQTNNHHLLKYNANLLSTGPTLQVLADAAEGKSDRYCTDVLNQITTARAPTHHGDRHGDLHGEAAGHAENTQRSLNAQRANSTVANRTAAAKEADPSQEQLGLPTSGSSLTSLLTGSIKLRESKRPRIT